MNEELEEIKGRLNKIIKEKEEKKEKKERNEGKERIGEKEKSRCFG